MYAPYPENMMESIKKVEATRAQRMATEPRRLSADEKLSLIHISEPTRQAEISYAVFCLKKKKSA